MTPSACSTTMCLTGGNCGSTLPKSVSIAWVAVISVGQGRLPVSRRPMVRFSKDYELGDVIVVFQQRPWQSWAELVDWLKANGPQFDWLTPGEIARMLADFSVLNDEN